MVDNSVSVNHTFKSQGKNMGLENAYYITLRQGTVTAFCQTCIYAAVSDVKDELRQAIDPKYDNLGTDYRWLYEEEFQKRISLEKEIENRKERQKVLAENIGLLISKPSGHRDGLGRVTQYKSPEHALRHRRAEQTENEIKLDGVLTQVASQFLLLKK